MFLLFGWLEKKMRTPDFPEKREPFFKYPQHDPFYGYREEKEQNMKTVSEAASERYPGATFDCALPQGWVDDCCDRGLDPRGHFVWLYADDVFGKPAPITAEGERIASVLSSHI